MKRRRLNSSMRRQILNITRAQKFGPRGTADSVDFFGPSLAEANDSQKLHRYQYKFKGKGRYSVARFLRDAGGIGEGIKKTYNSWIPKGLREQLVGIASNKLAAMGGSGLYTGRGAYYANDLIQGGVPSMNVSSANDETESICIGNREYVTDVYAPSSSTFTVNGVKLNPGLAANFPWLSQIAMNYEEYEFEKLIFFYRSTIDIGNANTSGQSGTVIMACDYNASHGLFSNKETMMQYHGAISGKCTDDISCGIECDYSKTADLAQFVRSGPVPSGEDPKTYDLGLFQFAINNVPSAMYNQQIGELWVEYKVRLRVPKLSVTRGFAQQSDEYVSASSTNLAFNQIFGTLPTNILSAQQNNIGTSISYSTTSYPPSATYAATGFTSTGIAPTLYSPSITSYTAAAGNLLLTLPAALNGTFKLKIHLQGFPTVATTWNVVTPSVLFYGNITPVVDIWRGCAVWGPGSYNSAYVANNTSTAQYSCFTIAAPQISVVDRSTFVIELHFSCVAATGAQNNMILIGTSQFTTVAGYYGIQGTQLCLDEYNPAFVPPSYLSYTGVITAPA